MAGIRGAIVLQLKAAITIFFLIANFLTAAIAADGQISVWNHNGSIVSLDAFGNSRLFRYVQPRQGLPAQPGDSVFEGSRAGSRYNGTAYMFSDRCGKLGYAVSGQVSSDQRQVVMSGMAPRRSSNCQVTSYFEDRLIFSFLRMENRDSFNASSALSQFENTPTWSTETPSQREEPSNPRLNSTLNAPIIGDINTNNKNSSNQSGGISAMTALYVFLFILWIIFMIIFFIPTIIAFRRGHPNRWVIFIINFVFGATVLGWFGCLIWACHAVHDPVGSSGSSRGGESGLNIFVNDRRRR